MYMTNLIARGQRIFSKGKNNKLYHIMNNMKFSKYIYDLDVDAFAIKTNTIKENKVYNDGAYVFYRDNKIIAVYDFVNQTLFSNDENLIKEI
jgi:hypothetical protein